MRKIFYLITISVFVVLIPYIFAQNGLYKAIVNTESGNYEASVEVENEEVVYVHWPNGEQTSVYGAKITDGRASGIDSKEKHIDIEINNYNRFSEGVREPVSYDTGEAREGVTYDTGEVREGATYNTGENRE